MTAVTVHGILAHTPEQKKEYYFQPVNALDEAPSVSQPGVISLNWLYGSDVDLFCPVCFRHTNEMGSVAPVPFPFCEDIILSHMNDIIS